MPKMPCYSLGFTIEGLGDNICNTRPAGCLKLLYRESCLIATTRPPSVSNAKWRIFILKGALEQDQLLHPLAFFYTNARKKTKIILQAKIHYQEIMGRGGSLCTCGIQLYLIHI